MDLIEVLKWTIALSYMITFIKDMIEFKELIQGERKTNLISFPSPSHVMLQRISGYLACSRTLTLVLTIASGFMIEAEFERCSIALVLHATACIVTTILVFWNNQETLHSFKQGCQFWFLNFMCLTYTVPCNNKSDFNETMSGYPWFPNNYFNLSIFKLSSNPNNKQLEGKLKETYTRLYISFITNIPSVILQSHFLFQSEARINEEGFHWLDVVRIVFVATTIIELATTVTTYELYSHEYTLQHYKLDKEVRPRGRIPEPDRFDFWGIFRDQLLTFANWVFISAIILGISVYHVSLFVPYMFFFNHRILVVHPELEKPYVNPPYGFHTVPSFWTMRIINTFSGVGTRLNKNPVKKVQMLVRSDIIQWLGLFFSQMRLHSAYSFAKILGVDEGSIGLRMEFLISIPLYYQQFNVLMTLLFYWKFKSSDEFVRLGDADLHYPMVSGYAFYNTLFEHVWEDSRNRLESLRTLMVTSLVVPERVHTDMVLYYKRVLKNRQLAVHSLRDHFITELGVIPDHDSVIRQIEGIRAIKLEEEFPFVHEFDEIMTTILKNEDEEEKFKDLKLFCWFYDNFDCVVRYLMSDKIMMVSEIMGLLEVQNRGMRIPYKVRVALGTVPLVYLLYRGVIDIFKLLDFFHFVHFEHLCG